MPKLQPPSNTDALIAIIDIGSNSIRLVVFDVSRRIPTPVFHDKVTCVLASGLYQSGKLKEQNMKKALDNLTRFSALVEAMQVDRVILLATAAVREASNGKSFAKQIESIFKHPVSIISGEEEARLSAFGVMSCIHDADGIVGDLGGGSLELAEICHHRLFNTITLPLGHKRLPDMAKGSIKDAQDVVDNYLKSIPWLKELRGREFYAVGGQWRRLALQHMKKIHYPVNVVHHYSVTPDELLGFFEGKPYKTPKNLANKSGKNQSNSILSAALVMQGILKIAKPSLVVFSGTSLREGCLYDLIHGGNNHFDPLIADCMDIAEQTGRFNGFERDLMQWLRPVIGYDLDYSQRLCQAAGLLWHFCASEHTDFRANIAFDRILYLPIVGADHPSRVFLALTLFARYAGHLKDPMLKPFLEYLIPEDTQRAKTLGLALRLAHTISAGVPSVLKQTHLLIEEKKLTLVANHDIKLITGDTVIKHLKDLAESLSIPAIVLETERSIQVL